MKRLSSRAWLVVRIAYIHDPSATVQQIELGTLEPTNTYTNLYATDGRKKRGWDEREIRTVAAADGAVGLPVRGPSIRHQDQGIKRTTECRSGVQGRHARQNRARVHDDAARLPSSESRRVAKPPSAERMLLL
jgi:hypothetical protein